MDEARVYLVAERLARTIDLLRNETREMDANLKHWQELIDQRLTQLENRTDDHEQRIRSATDGVTQFKMWAGLATGGSGLVSLIALLKAFLGGVP